MLFNSFPYIFVFLPVVVSGFFILNSSCRYRVSQAWLIAASIFFYAFWNPRYVPLMLFSIVFNYAVAAVMNNSTVFRKTALMLGIAGNIFLLGYYKYAHFIVSNINLATGSNIHMGKIALPLAISFFTFQQIAFLVDNYRGEAQQTDFLNYILFISFFPQLIAGPIVHHAELMPQFSDRRRKKVNYENISMGIFLFSIGLFKKTVIADFLSVFADWGFDQSSSLDFYRAWLTALSYTFQLYFDFSGYTDMALGSALMLNIRLPINFNAPYKALSIREFWQRWHITLSRFLQKYLYIPLGGNRRSAACTYRNLFLTFIIGGIWHGAGWTFIIWGALHGAGMVCHRIWRHSGLTLPRGVSWLATFMFVNFCWIFFRANTFQDAFKVIRGMVDVSSMSLPNLFLVLADHHGFIADYGIHLPFSTVELGTNTATLACVVLCLCTALLSRNSHEIIAGYRHSLSHEFYSSMLLFMALLMSFSDIPSKFIYFQF